MTLLRKNLRTLIRDHREDPARWGKPRGLTQKEAASKIGISPVWWRQIESIKSGAPTASAATLASMCHMLGITSAELRKRGYSDVAHILDIRYQNGQPDFDAVKLSPDTELFLRKVPGLTKDEQETLIAALRTMRYAPEDEADALVTALRGLRHAREPLGPDIWRHTRSG